MVDLQTRKLRYFVALAEELNFTRAAAGLFVAQQALSKQIRELEDDLGTALFNRTTRHVELTPAGETFLDAARRALAALDEGAAAALRAADGATGTLKLGFFIGAALELTPLIRQEFARRHPNVQLELRESGLEDTSGGLRDGWADAAFIRLPVSLEVETEPLFSEPVVVALSSSHPLAARDSVTVADLLAEPMVVGGGGDPTYSGFWTLKHHRPPGSHPRVRQSRSSTEEAELIAAGMVCMPTAACAARLMRYPGVSYVPIADAERSTLALAWLPGCRNPLLEDFRTVVQDVCRRERAVVQALENPF